MSKITLGQRLFYDVGPTCTYYHGPTLAQHSHAIWDVCPLGASHTQVCHSIQLPRASCRGVHPLGASCSAGRAESDSLPGLSAGQHRGLKAVPIIQHIYQSYGVGVRHKGSACNTTYTMQSVIWVISIETVKVASSQLSWELATFTVSIEIIIWCALVSDFSSQYSGIHGENPKNLLSELTM